MRKQCLSDTVWVTALWCTQGWDIPPSPPLSWFCYAPPLNPYFPKHSLSMLAEAGGTRWARTWRFVGQATHDGARLCMLYVRQRYDIGMRGMSGSILLLEALPKTTLVATQRRMYSINHRSNAIRWPSSFLVASLSVFGGPHALRGDIRKILPVV